MKPQTPGEILLVEDDVLSRFLTEQIIRRTFPDTSIQFFEDGQKFMNYFHASDKSNSVVILDLNMPIKNGFECLEEMNQLPSSQSCPVFILTSSISRVDRNRAQSFPMVVEYVEKPFNFISANSLKNISELEFN